VDARAAIRPGIERVGIVDGEILGEAPVDDDRLAVLADQDVRRLDIAMN
jgi:hypothetical protein